MDQQHYRRQFTYVTLFYVIGFALCFTATSVLLKDLSDAFSLPVKLEGSMSSISSIGSLLALVSMLFLQGRVKKSVVLGACGVILTACLVLKGFTSQYYVLLGVFFIFGIALGFSDGNLNAFVVDLNGAQAGKYLGSLHAFSGVGAMLAPLVITWVRQQTTWRGAYFILAAMVAVPFGIFILTGFRLKNKLHTEATHEVRLTFKDVVGYVKDRENLVILACLFLYTCAFNGMIVWITLYTERVLGAVSLKAFPLAVYWVFAACSRFFLPRTGLSPKKLFLIGTPVGAAFFLIGLLSRNPAIFIISCGLNGLFGGHCIPTLITMGCARYQDRSSLPSSLLVIMMYMAATISPIVMSAIADAASLQQSMYQTVACAFAATLVGLLLLKKPAKAVN